MARHPNASSNSDCHSRLASALEVFPTLDRDVSGKTVVDYGCGRGLLSADLSSLATLVYAVDIRPEIYTAARPNNVIVGGPNIVPDGVADIVLSINSFEHYAEPETVLKHWRFLLKPEGKVYLSFGPPWYHPYGAHMHFFTRIPWIHLWCPERFVMVWRSRYRADGAKRYEDVEGGLNRMSVSRCDHLLAVAGFDVVNSRNVPIRNIHWPLCTSIGRELWTSRVDRILSLS